MFVYIYLSIFIFIISYDDLILVESVIPHASAGLAIEESAEADCIPFARLTRVLPGPYQGPPPLVL